jgi:hypothetical protein
MRIDIDSYRDEAVMFHNFHLRVQRTIRNQKAKQHIRSKQTIWLMVTALMITSLPRGSARELRAISNPLLTERQTNAPAISPSFFELVNFCCHQPSICASKWTRSVLVEQQSLSPLVISDQLSSSRLRGRIAL